MSLRFSFFSIPGIDGIENFTDLWNIFTIIYVALIKTLPVILIVFLNIGLIRTLKIIWHRRRHMRKTNEESNMENSQINSQIRNQQRRQNWSVTNSRSVKEQKLAIILLMIAVKFLILTLPANIAYSIWALSDDPLKTNIRNEPLIFVSNLLESVNYSLNFYIYILIHKEIRGFFFDMSRAVVYFLTCGNFGHPEKHMNENMTLATIISHNDSTVLAY